MSPKNAELVVLTICLVTVVIALIAVDYAATLINEPTVWHGVRAVALGGTFALLIRFWYVFAHREER